MKIVMLKFGADSPPLTEQLMEQGVPRHLLETDQKTGQQMDACKLAIALLWHNALITDSEYNAIANKLGTKIETYFKSIADQCSNQGN